MTASLHIGGVLGAKHLQRRDKIIERYAIRCARGNNGGTWVDHYTEEQRDFWRQFVTDLIVDLKGEGL